MSILDDFQVVQSPVSGRRLDFDEFTDASTPMQSAYCRQMSEEEYVTMGETETEKALQVFIVILSRLRASGSLKREIKMWVKPTALPPSRESHSRPSEVRF